MIKIKLTLIILLLCSASAFAEYGGPFKDSGIDPSVIRIDEAKYLGSPIDRDYILIDRKEREFKLGDMLGKPLILVLSYYTCEGACPTANIRLKEMLGNIAGKKIGKDYRVLAVSFDKRDDINSLRTFDDRLGLPMEMWNEWKTTVLKNRNDIERLASSAGFKYFWSPADRVFLHPDVYIFVSPEGRIVRYLYGATADVKDMKLAITETGFGRIARSGIEELIDLFQIACYSYNFKDGKYALNYPVFIATGSLFLGISTIAISLILVRKKVRRQNYE